MKISDYTHCTDEHTQYLKYFNNLKENNRILFFDIETTGLSARNSTLYLIGALWYEDDHIRIRQWFNEDGYSEKELVTFFDSFCADFTHLIHFNGTTFDVPYVREKAKAHKLSISNIEALEQFDIFKEIRSYKKLLGLENMKQTSIEKFLGIAREDTCTGGDLINVYQRYVARPDAEKEHLLLLHNHDDLLGMPGVSNILCYKALFEHPEFSIQTLQYHAHEQSMQFALTLSKRCSLPRRFMTTSKNGIYINALDCSASLVVPVVQGQLKHYFKDYKSYYYLPQEDMAIHKSVATYVEPDRRERATKSNCYVKKEDTFVLCPDKDYPETFQTDVNDRTLYRTLDSVQNGTVDEQCEYVRMLLKSFL